MKGADRGYGLVAVLVTVVVLGGLAAAVVTSLPGGGSGTGRSGPGTTGLAAAPPPAQFNAAAQQACVANYQALESAVSEYQVETGSLPTSVAQLSSSLRGNPSTGQFTLTIDQAHPGQIQVQTPGRGPTDGDGNCRYAGQ